MLTGPHLGGRGFSALVWSTGPSNILTSGYATVVFSRRVSFCYLDLLSLLLKLFWSHFDLIGWKCTMPRVLVTLAYFWKIIQLLIRGMFCLISFPCLSNLLWPYSRSIAGNLSQNFQIRSRFVDKKYFWAYLLKPLIFVLSILRPWDVNFLKESLMIELKCQISSYWRQMRNERNLKVILHKGKIQMN